MKENKIKLSVLVPSYNRAKYISQTLDSILSQETKFNFNIIITDDASTDGTLDIAYDYQKKYPDKILVLPSEKNQRLLANIIKAYKKMNCEYFCVLDPDDYYVDKRFFQKAIDYLETHPDFNIYAANIKILFPNNVCHTQYDANMSSVVSNFQSLLDDYAVLGHTISSVFRNVVINEELISKLEKYIGDTYSEHSVREDDFRNRIHLYNSKAYFNNEVVGVYRYTNTGLFRGSNHLKQILMKARAYIDMYYFFEKKHPEFIDLSLKQLYRIINELGCTDLNSLFCFPSKDIVQFFKIISLINDANPVGLESFLFEFDLNRRNKTKFSKILKKLFSTSVLNFGNIYSKRIIKLFGFRATLKRVKKEFQDKINNAKYVHIMFNNKFNKPYVDFLNKYFDKNEHIILCKKWYRQYPFPKGDNVIEVQTIKNLKFNKNTKIICHSLFDNELVEYFYKHPNVLKKQAYWIIWGGDLYSAPHDKINDFVRANFKAYVGKYDEQVCREKYNIPDDKIFYDANYIFPITKAMLDNAQKVKKDFLQIQINNSSDASTLTALDSLAKYKDENIKITTVLSYGDLKYKDAIIEKGKEIFGDKFTYIDEYLSPEKYSEHLSQNDILILNQNRQQGVGNVMASLYLGAKVFIRSEISVFKSLNNSGIKIFDTNNIINLDYDKFVLYDEAKRNQNLAAVFFDEKSLACQWNRIFE